MSIKISFSIKDLESLSGVKAHTIRIWEKRYQLLSPNRSDTNIRNYDSSALKKLLNVVLLIDNGEKISKIAKLTDEEVYEEVKKMAIHDSVYTREINDFKLSMMELNVDFFEQTYAKLKVELSVREIFVNVLVPFLQEIGVLWITKTIKPIHEHFVSTLIKQKIYYNISIAQDTPKIDDKVYALFLPMDEIHDIGILYMHYELLNKGYNSIYFGKSLPMNDLKEIKKIYDKVTFISFITLEPKEGDKEGYISDIRSKVLTEPDDSLILMGRGVERIMEDRSYTNIVVYKDMMSFIENV